MTAPSAREFMVARILFGIFAVAFATLFLVFTSIFVAQRLWPVTEASLLEELQSDRDHLARQCLTTIGANPEATRAGAGISKEIDACTALALSIYPEK